MSKAAELAKVGEVFTNSPLSGRRNIVINGAMQIAQRSTSETGLGASSGYFVCDRWRLGIANTAGRLTMSQVTDTPNGFANALKLECTTADTSIAANEIAILQTKFEGQDLQQLKKGTADAEKLTVSFYVKGNAAATYTCKLQDNDNTRHNSQEFSVTTAWNRVVLTFDGDTSGVLDNDNDDSFRLEFWLHAGSTYTGGTHTSNTWNTTDNQIVGDNQTSFFDSTSRTFFITGVQMELGSVATPFEHRSFGEEEALCMRYYQLIASGNGETITNVNAYSSSTIFGCMDLAVRMRAAPTLDLVDAYAHYAHLRNGVADSFDSFSLVRSQVDRVEIYAANSTNGTLSHTAGHSGWLRSNHADGYFALTSEL